jgi:hypothetical protein
VIRTTHHALAFGLATTLVCGDAALATEVDRKHEITLYAARGVDSDLLEFFPKLIQGDLNFDDTWFVGLGYTRMLPTPDVMQRLFNALWLPNTRIGVEGVVVKHTGLQHNTELDLAFALRFGPMHLGPVTTRFGFSLGLSYAFGTPSYEDGPEDDPDRRYPLQNFNAYEFAFSHRDHPDWSLALRVHHRSGIYGVIAPRHVGSNFLALGIRANY